MRELWESNSLRLGPSAVSPAYNHQMQVRKRGFKREVQARHTKSTHSIQDGKHKEDSSEGQQIKLLFCVNLSGQCRSEGIMDLLHCRRNIWRAETLVAAEE